MDIGLANDGANDAIFRRPKIGAYDFVRTHSSNPSSSMDSSWNPE